MVNGSMNACQGVFMENENFLSAIVVMGHHLGIPKQTVLTFFAFDG